MIITKPRNTKSDHFDPKYSRDTSVAKFVKPINSYESENKIEPNKISK